MTETSTWSILRDIPDNAHVLDVGGWARPLRRANAVIDLGSYATRGWLGSIGPEPERFDEDSWVVRDICSRDPWPFPDKSFDFVYCGHTLEDVRDPIWVCEEMVRVGKSGFIESPSAESELCRGVESRYWVGHAHHRWLIIPGSGKLEFWAKPHFVNHMLRFNFPSPRLLRPEVEPVLRFAWNDSFSAYEEVSTSLIDAHARIYRIVFQATNSPWLKAWIRRWGKKLKLPESWNDP